MMARDETVVPGVGAIVLMSCTPPLPPEGTAPEGTRRALLAPNSIYYESAP